MFNKGTVTRLKNYLIEDGAVLTSEATTGSIYLEAGDLKIRVSDHLPSIFEADLIIMYTINMDTYMVSLHGSLICFKSLSDLRQFTKPLIINALLEAARPGFLSENNKIQKVQDIADSIIKDKNKEIEEINHKLSTSQGSLRAITKKAEEKDREIEKLKKQLVDIEKNFDVERKTYISGNQLKDGYGRLYNLGSFSANQIRTIQGFIDTNRHMGKLGFTEENKQGGGE